MIGILNYGIIKNTLNKCVRLYTTFGYLDLDFFIKLIDIYPSEIIVSFDSIEKNHKIFHFINENAIQHYITSSHNPNLVNVAVVLQKKYSKAFFSIVFDCEDSLETLEIYNSTVFQSIEECVNSDCINRTSQGYSDFSCIVSFDKNDLYVYIKKSNLYYQKIIDFIRSEKRILR